jgi:hypothetical protein
VKTKKMCVKDLSSFPLKQQWLDRCGQMRSRADARDKEVLFRQPSSPWRDLLRRRICRSWRSPHRAAAPRLARSWSAHRRAHKGELIERRLLCPDDPALKGAPRLALVRAQEHDRGTLPLMAQGTARRTAVALQILPPYVPAPCHRHCPACEQLTCHVCVAPCVSACTYRGPPRLSCRIGC